MTCKRKQIGQWKYHEDNECHILSVEVTCDKPPIEMIGATLPQTSTRNKSSILKGETWANRTNNTTFIGFSVEHTPEMTRSSCLVLDAGFESVNSAKRFVEKKIKEYITKYELKIIYP